MVRDSRGRKEWVALVRGVTLNTFLWDRNWNLLGAGVAWSMCPGHGLEYLELLKFLSPTNAPLYYTYKMLKYTARLSHDCTYMFRSTWTIIREPMPNLAKVTVLWK